MTTKRLLGFQTLVPRAVYSQPGLEKHVLKAVIQPFSLNILRGKQEWLRQKAATQTSLPNTNKHNQVTMEVCSKWWRLLTSPANPNYELYKLELPWFGAITCSPRIHRADEKKCSLNNFSDGNKIKGPLFEETLFKASSRECTH